VTGVARAFDPQTALLAKHAQHVVLVHFPIALFLTGVAFDWAGQWTRAKGSVRNGILQSAGCRGFNAAGACDGIACLAISTGSAEAQRHPAVAPSLGLHIQRVDLRGMVAAFSGAEAGAALSGYLWMIEAVGVAVVGLTGHLGGFLAGVNVG